MTISTMSDKMRRVNHIYRHPLYRKALKTIEREEAQRKFCCHDMEHFLSVARLACLYSLMEGAELEPSLIYGAALFHDIGRSLEYEEGIPHHKASVLLGEKILPECGFESGEQEMILQAIRSHRQLPQEGGQAHQSSLGEYLYRADKESRLCFSCKVRGQCKWPEDKQNLEIRF